MVVVYLNSRNIPTLQRQSLSSLYVLVGFWSSYSCETLLYGRMFSSYQTESLLSQPTTCRKSARLQDQPCIALFLPWRMTFQASGMLQSKSLPVYGLFSIRVYSLLLQCNSIGVWIVIVLHEEQWFGRRRSEGACSSHRAEPSLSLLKAVHWYISEEHQHLDLF